MYPNSQDESLQLAGTVLSDTHDTGEGRSSTVLIDLDPQLREQRRVALPPDIIPNISFRLRDQTILIFGSTLHTFGETYTSLVTRVNTSGKVLSKLTPTFGSLYDTGRIDTASPVVDSKFAFAIRTASRDAASLSELSHNRPGSLKGAAIYLVETR